MEPQQQQQQQQSQLQLQQQSNQKPPMNQQLQPPGKQIDLLNQSISPVQVGDSKQLARRTRYLCAVIVSLVIVILILVLFDRPGIRQPSAKVQHGPTSKLGNSLDSRMMVAASSNSDNHYLFPNNDDQEEPENEHGSNDDDGSQNQLLSGRIFRGGESFLSRFGRKQSRNQQAPICMSPGCIRAAAQILNNMDNKTKPCEDFYQFACGRWIDTQLIPDDKTSLTVFSQNNADLDVKLRALIEKKPSDKDPAIVGEMRNLYASCMNLTDIETRGDEPLTSDIREFGGWPVVMSGSSSPATIRATRSAAFKFNWLETIIKFRERGFSHDMIIDLSVVPDVKNSRRFIIELDQSSLALPDRSYYLKGMNDTTVAAYYNLMVDSAVMLGAERGEARRQMWEVLEFETSLAKISVPREQRRNSTRLYNKMAAKDLYTLAPNIDWQRYLRQLLRDDQLNMETDKVIVKVPSFIKSLDILLTNTEPRIIANYMIWRIIRHSMGGLSRKWRELIHGYSTITTGRQAEEPRWEQCLGSLEGTLGTALSALYVKNHFNRRSKSAALEMVDYIRNEFLNILDEIDWMDDETRQEAKLKAKAIAPFIGYPDELLQDNLIEELYKGLKLSSTNFYQNIRSLRIWSTNYAFEQLRKPNKRGDWKKHARAAVVNAYYNSLENSIEFPAGILQGAFFDAERPSYMNFGAIGFVIGHEITHGFDDRGRQFDKEGNNRNWWNNETDQKFKDRAQCIIDQYSNYTVNGLKVNGINTQGENIADNGGLKEAFRAYNEWVRRNGPEPTLPGVKLNQEQLFWVSAANIWCGKYRPEVLKVRVTAGSHSPAQFRINGPLSNLKEFSETFNCPLGSPLNPVKKCSVW